ncbi:MAG TPA: GNAT family N-acetyltransferase [Kofleriaceae bacterium]|nr:GNAT family N-acetyltransferase [Kofleriaceae bacterium]
MPGATSPDDATRGHPRAGDRPGVPDDATRGHPRAGDRPGEPDDATCDDPYTGDRACAPDDATCSDPRTGERPGVPDDAPHNSRAGDPPREPDDAPHNSRRATGCPVQIAALDRAALAEVTGVLAAACRFDRAAEVADEKVFGDGPAGPPQPLGAWDGDALVGVAAIAGDRVRVLAVTPAARRRGVGSALLSACIEAARAAGASTLRTLDQPGNYLAPGIDERNAEAIGWLERRGFRRLPEPRVDVLIDVRGNPRVSAERAGELAAAAAERGYEVRRARPGEPALLDAVAAEFGGAWPFELARALDFDPPAVHVALRDGAYAAFAAHDGNNRGLGWFGPTGTWPAHRGNGLGEALLVACLVDVAARHPQCEVAWIGPRAFYDKVAGIAGERRFHVLVRDLG